MCSKRAHITKGRVLYHNQSDATIYPVCILKWAYNHGFA